MDLKNKMVAILVAPKFHDEETTAPAAFLREHGAEVRYIGIQKGTCQGKGGTTLTVDSPITDVQPNEFDGLLIPGGGAPEHLRLNKDVLAFVKAFMDAGKPVAAICHGAQLLAGAGVLKGRKLTAYPAVGPEVTLAGANYVEVPVTEAVVDGNLVTAPAWPAHPAWLAQFIRLLGVQTPVASAAGA
jgi:protease I